MQGYSVTVSSVSTCILRAKDHRAFALGFGVEGGLGSTSSAEASRFSVGFKGLIRIQSLGE